ncbi:glycine zipper family protein [Alginatibacterium sediminis]|uniref:Glycine zipper family protein n=1 Tax=Alginatibacterium sediminis TaxID=2164068 RepID=A0A420E5V8_9ALTE|nr:glycine zipper family protein [Alginatibacterium sediminis]RKF12834.1 glycine zipper family protein [Alginatibacterium sediminis]
MFKFTSILVLSLFSSLASATIIVDRKGVDEREYAADMHECTQMSLQVEQEAATRGGAVSGAAKGAAIGAAGKAIAGGSGTEGAKTGAAIGMGAGVLSRGSDRRRVADNFQAEQEQVVRNCMTGRGYTVLN